MSQRILITGAAGFIGCHLADYFSAQDDNELVLVDNLQRGRDDAAFTKVRARPNVHFVQCDLTDPGILQMLDGNFDLVFHLAAMVGVRHCLARPAAVLETNLRSTLNVLDFVCDRRCGKLIFSSTSEVYAGAHELGVLPIPTAEDVPIVIADPAHPRTSYAGSKLVGEQLVRFKCADVGIPFAIVRFHNVYGPRMGYVHVIPEIIRRVWEKETPLAIYGRDETRAFCYVDDAVAAMAEVAAKVEGEVVHVGTQQETTIENLYELILNRLDYHPDTTEAPSAEGSVKRRCPDVTKLKKLTGFEARVGLEEGVAKTCDWYLDDLNRNGPSE